MQEQKDFGRIGVSFGKSKEIEVIVANVEVLKQEVEERQRNRASSF